jgi:prevent-host-death family protein
MIRISATEAKSHFGKLLDTARRESVAIEKQGRAVAVILSREEFERLSEIEDNLWVLKANAAKNEGFLSEEESDKFLDELLHA